MTDKQLTQHDSMSAFRERAALALVLTEFCVLALMPELAWAVDAPWDNVTGKLVISVKGMVEGITFIAVAVVSFLSYRGRVPWGWAFSVMFGAVLIFGYDQFISWVKS